MIFADKRTLNFLSANLVGTDEKFMVALPDKNNNVFSGKSCLNKRKWSKLKYLKQGFEL
jgi:hypothetical protein